MAGTHGRTVLFMFVATFIWFNAQNAFVSCALTSELQSKISKINQEGPYLGLVIPNSFELNPLLQNPSYTPTDTIIDFAGRRFRFGSIGDKPVVLVMTGLSVINAAITTQLLLSIFNIDGVVHYGIAGNANPSLHIGDVAIPLYWAHLRLWSWQRFGLGADDTLPLENFGDYTRDVGFIKFSDFTSNISAADSVTVDNHLNTLWYQPEEIFPIDGIPEQRQHALWVPVDSNYYLIAKKTREYEARSVHRFRHMFDNNTKVALVCLQQRIPFIAIRALSDLAGGGTAESNEADTFVSLAATNSVAVVIEFVKLLSGHSQW
ncbi:hypothetical protein KIW84_050746 [Lathyrus oleraceus]|uniref:Nucleoside phosphorylase domain-containing protein n=1 Tax=Pisum sativum TaxID=3888 RepID=A0A9D5AF14_PEA|nr:hypothetical protein KIW84_050746 [Pisum sativum]